MAKQGVDTYKILRLIAGDCFVVPLGRTPRNDAAIIKLQHQKSFAQTDS
jgi:hypothetical protein